MSGGHFDYKQYELRNIADSIEQAIIDNVSTELNEYGEPKSLGLSEKTIRVFQQTARDLRQVLVYVQRIDWLLSGDDGEETFHNRLQDDMIEWNIKEFNRE